jgi:hypothetical protein
MWIHNARVLTTQVLVGAVVFVASFGTVTAQIPDKFENLKVLPKDISKRDLIDVMRGFSGALGFRCHNCHVGEPGPGLDGYDFVSDEKKNKLAAREMMKMVADINGKYIAGIKTGHDPKIQVNCRTCHHGQERPRSLIEILDELYAAEGADAMLAKYSELHENFYGRDSFDFGEYVFDDLAGKIAQGGKPDDARALIELHAETVGESSHLETVLGEIQRAAGNLPAAKAHYEKALKLDPQNRMAKHQLEQMKE